MLSIRDLMFSYGETPILKGVSFVPSIFRSSGRSSTA